MRDTPPTLMEGTVIADRFQVEVLAGSGGMGSIYRARDLETGEAVALKVMQGAASQVNERFAREARILAELSHPSIVRYIAHGKLPTGVLYLVMEWLDGEDLQQRFKRGAALGLAETLTLARRVAGALAAAHARGIVHRDVKPPNLFLPGRDPAHVKLLDFGIARIAEGATATLTGMMLGTPGYMAPEQVRGQRAVDARADVFALGCVLYRCLAGRLAFGGDDIVAILAKLIFEEPPRLRQIRPEIPAALDDLVARMLAKSPDGRPASAAEILPVIEAIELALATPLESPRAAPPAAVRPAIQAAEPPVLAPAPAPPGGPAAPPVPTSDPTIVRATPLSPPIARLALSSAELRMMSVVVTRPGTVGWDDGGAWQRLGAAVAPFGADLVALPDGSVVTTLNATGEPTDQAAQAARCALALRAALPGCDMVLTTGRSVIASGRLLGEAIDRAASMLRGAAPPRAGATRIRIDEITAGLLGSEFIITGDEQSLFLDGERGPLDTTERTLLGKPTPCVGRDQELDALMAIYADCIGEPSARVVLVTAPPGLGKSRLRYELIRRVRDWDSLVDIWIARGDPVGAGSPFRLLAQLIRRAAGVSDGEPLAVRRQKIRARVGRRFHEPDLSRIAEFLGELSGSPFSDDESLLLRSARHDPMRMGDQLRRAWEDFLEAECDARPILIVLEDLQWGDLPSVQSIDAAMRNLRDRRLMVLALGRPEVHNIFPGLWKERCVHELHLPELTAAASERLVRAVLGMRASPDVVENIVERSGGNAFYLEEMIRAVAAGRTALITDTVLAMVQAWIEHLAPAGRRLLRAASVFGQVFWRGGVQTLLGAGAEPAHVLAWLEDLTRQEIISRRSASRFPGDDEYVFRSEVMRDAAYGMLTEDDKTLGHRLAASWLLEAGESDAAALAEHLERGGERDRAVAWHRRAAEQALEGNDFAAALASTERAMACGAKDAVAGALLRIQAEAHKWRGNNAEAERCAAEAMRRLPRGSRSWSMAAADLATVAAKMGHHDRLLLVAGEIRAITAEQEDREAHAIACARVAIQLLHTGHLAPAEDLLAAAESEVQALGEAEPAALAPIYQARAIRSMFTGDVGAFLGLMHAAAQSFARAGDRRSASTQRANVAYAHIELGAYAEAERILREVIALAERLNLQDLAAGSRHNLGIALARLGKFEEARAMETRALKVAATQNNRRLESGCRTYLAAILFLARDLDGAEREARAAVDILSAAPPMRAHALAILGRVLVVAGRPREALHATQEAMSLMRSASGIEEGESMAWLAHIEALLACGHAEDFKAALPVARDRLRTRAEQISDPGWRTSFLYHVPENARILELARQRLGT